MTDKTLTQGLTRTTPADDPKEMAAYLAALAGDVDQRMVAQRFHQARSKVPPAAMIEITTPVLVNSGGPGTLVYDRVAFDTGGLVDLSVDPRLITLNSPGYWCIGAYMRCSGFGGTGVAVGIWLGHGGSNSIVDFHDSGIGVVAGSYSVIEQTTVAGSEIASCGLTPIGTGPGPTTTVAYASLWAYKIRDL